ncbi:MAG: hypothetical protein HYY76_06365 [Acidobacteria bacterium]|nr:hypothetical protein [Acidobacteriota bacterium]
MSRRELESLVVRRAWEDDRFRRRLLRNPRRTIERELRRVTGGAVRLDRGVVVCEADRQAPPIASTLHVVLSW